MAGGHDQLWKDLIRAFPVDFLRLVDDELAARLVAPKGFLERPEPLAWAFAALGRPKDRDRYKLRRACFAKIAAADDLTDVERFLLFNCVATYLELGGGAAQEYAALRTRFTKPEVEMKPVTWEEKVEARGLEKGREQGLEKGLARGQENGMREVLLRLLRSRFPSLTGRTIERVEAIRSPEELGSLAERLLTARSLEELGLA
ncbi:MAG TPA: hypothetical protein VGS22_25535 [Thermoanaerobaculia bacterium]|jgi:hypothetical protein|nr:hypothetical protein [Thermoanaerobaculia bacterium]